MDVERAPRMSDAARKAASEGMKTYRAKRKATAAAKKNY